MVMIYIEPWEMCFIYPEKKIAEKFSLWFSKTHVPT